MSNVDLGQLVGGKSCSIPCTIFRNGFQVFSSALADTGANAFALVDTKCARKLSEYLATPFEKLPRPIQVRGYNGSGVQSITTVLRMHICVDGRRQYNTPFLVADLGHFDLILGRKWLSYLKLQLDVQSRRLIWPKDLPPTPCFVKEAGIAIEALLRPAREPAHQADANRRDAAFEKDAQLDPERVRILQRPQDEGQPVITAATKDSSPPLSTARSQRPQWTLGAIERHTELADRRDNLRTMERELQLLESPVKLPRIRKSPVTVRKSLPRVDICGIGAAGFRRNLERPGAVVFVTSLCEIDRLIEEKQRPPSDEDLTDEQLLELKLLAPYHDLQDVFSQAASNTLPPHRPYDHKIELEGDGEAGLGYSPLRQQSAEELLATKQYVVEHLGKGFIESSKAPFAAPILFVRKANGSLRFCVDFRKLNALTRKDRYPLPLLEETLARMSKAKIFTKLDIRQAFYRIRMHPDSEDLTTFRTRYGTYKCKVLPFGLTNGPATWQRYMNDTLFDYLDDFCTAYLDDIMIYSENELEHVEHVRKVLIRLREAGLQADIRKSEFHVKRTKYLGFIISTDGIATDPEKTSVIQQWEPPRTVKGVQSFLGFCNFYRRFIKDYGRVARPLNRLVRKDQPFVFNSDCYAAFQELKKRLVSAPVLAHFNPNLPLRVETDASDGVTGGVLSQKHADGEWHPVAFLSKTMVGAELNYPIHDKELLAIIHSFQHWRAELEGTPQVIEVLSDHSALEYFMTTKVLTARQARWAEVLSRYNFQIMYRPGVRNQVDALTRREQDSDASQDAKSSLRMQILLKPEQIDPQVQLELATDQVLGTLETDSGLDLVDDLLRTNRTAESLKDLREEAWNPKSVWTLKNGLLKYQGRLMVADEPGLRTRLIAEAHGQVSTAHPGKSKTRKLLCTRYYWPGMTADIDRFVRNCDSCQRSKIPRDKTPGLLKPLPIPDRPWQHISMDFHELPTDRNGYNMVLVLVDRFGKRTISIPCFKNINAKETARLYIQYVYRTYRPLDTVVSDRGPQFVSAF